MSKDILCPVCQKRHNWLQSKPWSPFCCERCKIIDLGNWASEKHAIPGKSVYNFNDQEEGIDKL